MGLVILRHGQDWDHGDGTVDAFLSSGTLIHGSQVGVQIARVSTTAGNLFPGCGDLTQCFGVVGDICHDDQYVHVLLESQILGSGQRHTGGCDTLNGRVVCQVHEHDGTVDGAGPTEVGNEEVCFLISNTDGCEYNGEVTVCIQHLCLTGDLCSQLCVGQTGSGENRKLLSTNQRVQPVNGRYTGLNKLGRIVTGCRVHRQAVHVSHFVRDDLRTAVDGVSHTIEDTSQHIRGYGQLNAVAQETHLALCQIDAGGVLKQLYEHVVAVDLQNTAVADVAVGELDLTQLVVSDAFYSFHQHQRAGNFGYGLIFFQHYSSASFPISS